LAPVLRKHFDPNVNLVCVAEKIQPNAFEPHAKSAYAGCFDFGKSQKAKLGGPSRPSRVINKEINLVQTDDNEDDAENFEVRPKDESELKKESGLSEETTMELARELYGTPREKRPDTKNSVHGGNVEPKTRSVIDQPPVVNSIKKFRVSKPSLTCGSTNDLAVQARHPNLLRRGEPHSIRQQVINELYEQTIGMSTRTIKSFHESHDSRLALPDIWKEILTHRQSNSMWIRGSRDCFPYPRQSSHTSMRPNGSLHPVAKAVQNTAYSALRQNAELDL
jgi:hypothetical protein